MPEDIQSGLNPVNIGSEANDGTGDKLRDAFDKLNNNDQYLRSLVAQLQTAIGELEEGEPGDMYGGIEVYDPEKEYLPGPELYVFSDGSVYLFISETAQTGATPADSPSIWEQTPWSTFYHIQNTDFKTGKYVVRGEWSSGQINLNTEQYHGKNIILLETTGSTERDIWFALMGTMANVPYPFKHKAIIYVIDDNTYKFEANPGLVTPSGATITLSKGQFMEIDFVPFTYTPDLNDPSNTFTGRYVVTGTSFREPVEGMTPEFIIGEDLVFKYRITGDAAYTTIYDFNSMILDGTDDAITHSNTPHEVTAAGGFQAGANASAVNSEGVAIGKNAVVGDGINAIQIGGGVNDAQGTVKFYGYPLIQPNGLIYPSRLPSSSVRPVELTSDQVILASTSIQSYIVRCLNGHVDIVLPSASGNENMPITFRLGAQNSGYAMTIERSGTDGIYVNGDMWNGITSDVLGFWVTLISDGQSWYVSADSGITTVNNASY